MAWKEAFLPADPPKEALGRQKDVSNMRLSSQERKSNMVIASLGLPSRENIGGWVSKRMYGGHRKHRRIPELRPHTPTDDCLWR
jgi:hypothetical protein